MVIANILRVLLCIYMVYLIGVKLYYRHVLPPLAAGILIDIIQLCLSVYPFIIWISSPTTGPVSDIINNNRNIDFLSLAYS